jgi:ankyrin repeat protein
MHFNGIANTPISQKKSLKQLRFEARRADQKQRKAHRASKQKSLLLKKSAAQSASNDSAQSVPYFLALNTADDLPAFPASDDLPAFPAPSASSVAMPTTSAFAVAATTSYVGSAGMTSAYADNQHTALVVHTDRNSQTALQVYRKKPSDTLRIKLAEFDKATKFKGSPRYAGVGAVRVQDFHDPELAEEEPLLMLNAPTNTDTALVKACEALSETAQVSNAGITNLLISELKKNEEDGQLMIDSTDLDKDPLCPALLVLAKTPHNNYALTRALINRGAPVNKASSFNEKPLHLACQKGNYQIVLALLEEPHAEIDALTYSCELKEKKAFSEKQQKERAQQAGADFANFQTDIGQAHVQEFAPIRVAHTPLMLAVKKQLRFCVILMILSGAQLQLAGTQEHEDLDRTLKFTALDYAEQALDTELLKGNNGNVKIAQEIINLLRDNETIEVHLNEAEIVLLKKYFLERYPDLASIAFPENLQWIVCRYLGFTRWDDQSLTRAREATPVQVLMTEERLQQLQSILGLSAKTTKKPVESVESEDLPQFVQPPTAAHSLTLLTEIDTTLAQAPKTESEKAVCIQVAAKVSKAINKNAEIAKQQEEFSAALEEAFTPTRTLFQLINIECEAPRKKLFDALIASLANETLQSTQPENSDLVNLDKALAIINTALKDNSASEQSIANCIHAAASAYMLLPQELQQNSAIAHQEQRFASALQKAFLMARNVLGLIKQANVALQKAKDAERQALLEPQAPTATASAVAKKI